MLKRAAMMDDEKAMCAGKFELERNYKARYAARFMSKVQRTDVKLTKLEEKAGLLLNSFKDHVA